jgi:EamA-like transporter family
VQGAFHRHLGKRNAVGLGPKKTALLAFLFLGVIWGSNFIFMKWAAEEISPAQVVLLRAVFGFLPVFLYALSQRTLRWQHVRHAHTSSSCHFSPRPSIILPSPPARPFFHRASPAC